MKNLKKAMIPVALAATMSFAAFLAACGENDESGDKWRDQSIWLQQDPLVPSEAAALPENVSYTAPLGAVHDPSIFHDPKSGAYYAYGTHYAVAKTFDLDVAFADANSGGWEQLAGDSTGSYAYLFGENHKDCDDFRHPASNAKWPEAIRSTVELVNPGSEGGDAATTTWAPDVEYINGKYYMYYSLTRNFGSDKSAIARVESDSPEGTFANNTIIVDSVNASGAHPNCIDPELFYDKEGKLWMVYGSAAGGIYIKELYAEGENAGLPKEDGFGKKIWRSGGGAGKNEEGPFVYYNASTQYYYLMTSHARLQVNYNMHVARSANPDGPYVGIDGKDVATDGDGNLVSGNFRFDRSGKGESQGFAAMGHNSVVKDKNGKYYAVYHARRIDGTGKVNQAHKLYVSQIYFNEDGWPVLAPTPYVGETRGTMTEEQIASEYDIVVHAVPGDRSSGANYVSTFVKSAAYTLAADGKVTGSGVKSGDGWTLKQNYYIEITLGGVTYKGVVAPGWDVYTVGAANQKGVVTISAVSDQGVSLWAVQK